MEKEIDFSLLTRNDIINAMREYEKIKNTSHYNFHRESINYLLIYKGNEYPHKYIVGIAYSLKNNLPEILDSKTYNSTGNHKKSAKWCIERNGFDLFEYGKFRDFLKQKFNKKSTIDTYMSDLKRGIKIIQNIKGFEGKNIKEIIDDIINNEIEKQDFESAMKKLNMNDFQLYLNLKNLAMLYKEAVKGDIGMECKNKIIEIKKVIESEEFYFEKLRKIFNNFEGYLIDNNEINKLLNQIGKKFSFQEFLDNNSDKKDFILLIGKIIAMSDYNGYNKNKWNEYKDKRIVAKASIRQNDWVRNLLLYKRNKSLNELASGVRHFIEFIKNPSKNLTHLSKKHRGLIAKHLLNKDYNSKTFFDDVRIYFENRAGNYIKKLKNEENIGVLLSLLLNCDEIKKIWKKEQRQDREKKENIVKIKKQQDRFPLNQILYGPPGTGKTYSVIERALEIIYEKEDGNKEIEFEIFEDESKKKVKASYEEILNFEGSEKRRYLKGLYEYYRKNGQIEFVTFHQSFSYEEFIEGIKPCDLDDCDSERSEIKYHIEDGIFKDICERGENIIYSSSNENIDLEKVNIWKLSLGEKGRNADEIFEFCKNNNIVLLGYDETFKDGYGKWAYDTFTKLNIGDLIIVSHGLHKVKAIGIITGDVFKDENLSYGGYEIARKVKWLLIPEKPFNYQKILKRQFSQATIYNIKSNVKKEALKDLLTNSKKDKNHILIIDEINRGNISKIFGELITLIEEDKRLGNKEEMRVILPYSKEPFGVPKNLYIIGTMNTADRSIALMDTALRRRFEFIEMMPEYDNLPEIDGINVSKMLEAINERIEYLYDRDHTIGHAYFMGIETFEELKEIFKNKIIPLLQEYFYDDWEKIDLVLNNNGFIKEKKFKYITDLDEDKRVYEIDKSAFDERENYIRIYENEK